MKYDNGKQRFRAQSVIARREVGEKLWLLPLGWMISAVLSTACGLIYVTTGGWHTAHLKPARSRPARPARRRTRKHHIRRCFLAGCFLRTLRVPAPRHHRPFMHRGVAAVQRTRVLH